jgi:hypothetical protein
VRVLLGDIEWQATPDLVPHNSAVFSSSALARCVSLGFGLTAKSTTSLPLPQRYYLLAIFALKGKGEFKERTVQHGPIVPCEFHKPGFDD